MGKDAGYNPLIPNRYMSADYYSDTSPECSERCTCYYILRIVHAQMFPGDSDYECKRVNNKMRQDIAVQIRKQQRPYKKPARYARWGTTCPLPRAHDSHILQPPVNGLSLRRTAAASTNSHRSSETTRRHMRPGVDALIGRRLLPGHEVVRVGQCRMMLSSQGVRVLGH